MTELTLEELAKLDGLSAEVTRCQAIADAGNDGFYMQVTYAEEDLGRAMVENRDALLARARALVRVRGALAFRDKDAFACVSDLDPRKPTPHTLDETEHGDNFTAPAFLALAAELGWPDPLPPSERKGEG